MLSVILLLHNLSMGSGIVIAQAVTVDIVLGLLVWRYMVAR
jgi:hypothetical protein